MWEKLMKSSKELKLKGDFLADLGELQFFFNSLMVPHNNCSLVVSPQMLHNVYVEGITSSCSSLWIFH